jgi:hypothetical protein
MMQHPVHLLLLLLLLLLPTAPLLVLLLFLTVLPPLLLLLLVLLTVLLQHCDNRLLAKPTSQHIKPATRCGRNMPLLLSLLQFSWHPLLLLLCCSHQLIPGC